MSALTPGRITLAELRALWNGAPFALDPAAWPEVEASAASVAAIIAAGERVYGINTGFGLLAATRIAPDRLLDLQRNLILSHCCGLGPPIEPRVVRLAMALKVIGLARGCSGVSRPLVERLIRFIEADAVPLVPIQGSVGASGDLAPLAHLAAALIGEGELLLEGERMSSGEAHGRLGLDPLVLGPKEGLALINGTQISTALALDALFIAEHVFASAILAGALSLEALKGSRRAFDPRIHEARGQPGQIAVAAAIDFLLEDSEIMRSHTACERVQDPYSFRCQPQVMGACLDLIRNAAATLTIEAGAVTDNPLILDGEAVSGGNFHAEPIAFAADMLAIALCEIGSISERRTAILTDPKMSGLPPFLIAQVSAAALVSENKSLAFPASVDSIPTSAGQEDHVSMATHGAARTRRIADNAAGVIGIELIAAAQGVDLHAPLKTGPALQTAHAAIRRHVPFLKADRLLAPDIAWAQTAVLDNRLAGDVAGGLFEMDQPGTV